MGPDGGPDFAVSDRLSGDLDASLPMHSQLPMRKRSSSMPQAPPMGRRASASAATGTGTGTGTTATAANPSEAFKARAASSIPLYSTQQEPPSPPDPELTPSGCTALLATFFLATPLTVHRQLFELCWTPAGQNHPLHRVFTHPLLLHSMLFVGTHYAMDKTFIDRRAAMGDVPTIYSRTLNLPSLHNALREHVRIHFNSTVSQLFALLERPYDPVDALAVFVSLAAGIRACFLDGQVSGPTTALRSGFYALRRLGIAESIAMSHYQDSQSGKSQAEEVLRWIIHQTWLRTIWYGFIFSECTGVGIQRASTIMVDIPTEFPGLPLPAPDHVFHQVDLSYPDKLFTCSELFAFPLPRPPVSDGAAVVKLAISSMPTDGSCTLLLLTSFAVAKISEFANWLDTRSDGLTISDVIAAAEWPLSSSHSTQARSVSAGSPAGSTGSASGASPSAGFGFTPLIPFTVTNSSQSAGSPGGAAGGAVHGGAPAQGSPTPSNSLRQPTPSPGMPPAHLVHMFPQASHPKFDEARRRYRAVLELLDAIQAGLPMELATLPPHASLYTLTEIFRTWYPNDPLPQRTASQVFDSLTWLRLGQLIARSPDSFSWVSGSRATAAAGAAAELASLDDPSTYPPQLAAWFLSPSFEHAVAQAFNIAACAHGLLASPPEVPLVTFSIAVIYAANFLGQNVRRLAAIPGTEQTISLVASHISTCLEYLDAQAPSFLKTQMVLLRSVLAGGASIPVEVGNRLRLMRDG